MLLLLTLLFLHYDLLFCQQFYAAQTLALGRTQTKHHQTSADRSKVKQIEKQGRTTLNPVISSVIEKLLEDFREDLATSNADDMKEQTEEEIGHGPNIPTKGITNQPHKNKMINQETLIKESDSKPDENKEMFKELNKSDRLMTSDADDSKTAERKNKEDRVLIEDSSTDSDGEEKVTGEEREETTPELADAAGESKTIDFSDESSEPLIMNGIDDAQIDKLNKIFNMLRKNTKKEETTKTKETQTKPRRIKTTKSVVYGVSNNVFLGKTTSRKKVKKVTKSTLIKDETSTQKKIHLKKIIERPITVRQVHTTRHKRLHANKLIIEMNDVRNVEPTKHTKNENYEVAKTTTLSTTVQMNVKRMPKTTTTMLPYFQMIDDLNEGYMVVFLIELMRIMASKDKDDLYEVLVHTEQIVMQLCTAGKILWLGQPLLDITKRLAKFMTEAETGVTKQYASKLKRKIVGRQLELSSEVNIIIDYADMLYDDEEGRKLFSVLKDFDDYPNTTQTGYAVCSALIENFLKPYRRLSNTELRQQLIDSINLELRARIPEANLSKWNALTFIDTEKSIEQWPSVESDSETSVSASKKNQKILRQKLQKLKHPTLQRQSTRLQPDYSSENNYRRKFSYRPETQYKYPLLRNMKPITNIQRRFKIITPRHRQKMLRHWSTPSYIVNLISRPTKEFTTKLNKVKHQASTRFPFFLETIRFRTKHRNEDRIENLHNRNATNYHKNKTHLYNGMKDRIRQMAAARKAERLKMIRN